MAKKSGKDGRPKGPKHSAPVLKGFGRRLRELRKKRGLTQPELAAAIESDWTQISRYERDLNFPTAERLLALAQALRTTPNGLLLGSRNQDEKLPFKSLRLYQLVRTLERLPRSLQNVAERVLEALIFQHGRGKKR